MTQLVICGRSQKQSATPNCGKVPVLETALVLFINLVLHLVVETTPRWPLLDRLIRIVESRCRRVARRHQFIAL